MTEEKKKKKKKQKVVHIVNDSLYNIIGINGFRPFCHECEQCMIFLHLACRRIIKELGFGSCYEDKEKVHEKEVTEEDLMRNLQNLWIWKRVENIDQQIAYRMKRSIEHLIGYINQLLNGFYAFTICKTDADPKKYRLKLDDLFTFHYRDDRTPYLIHPEDQ